MRSRIPSRRGPCTQIQTSRWVAGATWVIVRYTFELRDGLNQVVPAAGPNPALGAITYQLDPLC